MSQTCPLCNGEGYRSIKIIHPHTKKPWIKKEPCLCTLSSHISEVHKLLSYLGAYYLPFEKSHKELVFTPKELAKSPNFLISGDYESLCLNVKNLIMKNWLKEPRPSVRFSRAIGVLHDFYVKQNDGSSPQLSEIDKYDLVVICLDTQEKNAQLGTCIAQVVYSRSTKKRPTWLYLPPGRPTLSSCPQEYSEDLNRLTADFKKIMLNSTDTSRTTIITDSQDDAANFGGLL